jgi:hypothetical protein
VLPHPPPMPASYLGRPLTLRMVAWPWFQLAWYICLAVLIDTFVVRACLVPSLMAVLGDYNWWPLKMPPVRPLLLHTLFALPPRSPCSRAECPPLSGDRRFCSGDAW